MKLACVHALAALAKEPLLGSKTGESALTRERLIPSPFDSRLTTSFAPAVASAAVASGVATRPQTGRGVGQRMTQGCEPALAGAPAAERVRSSKIRPSRIRIGTANAAKPTEK